MPYTVCLVPIAINTSGTSSTSVCAHTHACVYVLITHDDHDYDCYVRSSNKRQLHEEQLLKETVLSRIRPAT